MSFHKRNKIDSINNGFFLITSKTNELIHYYDLEIFSRYQRQGHYINSPNFSEQLYSQCGINTEIEKAFFLTSCQAIHYALFKSVLSIDPNTTLLFGTNRIYFETLNAWNALKSVSNNLPNAKNIFLLDSAFIESQNDLLKFTEQEIDFLIFDTTCFDRQSEEIKIVMKKVLENKTPTVITRSHLKIDSFGEEYGLLSSVVFLNFETVPGMNILKLFNEEVSMMGAFAPIANIYPYIIDEDLKNISSLRNNLIKKNCQYLMDSLQEVCSQNNLTINSFFHRQYFTVTYPGKCNNFSKIGQGFIKLCKVYGVDGKFCDSFGFDFLSLTNVNSFDKKNNLSFLRICPGADDGDLQKKIQLFNSFLKNLSMLIE